MKKISVCMATFNGARFIRQQVDSILPQLNQYDEIIVSDDGSTDNTLAILASYGDKRITIVNSSRTGSPVKNFERGLSHCTGDYIFLADQDDIWLPHKVSVVTPNFKEYDLVLTDCSVVNEENEIQVSSFFTFQKSKTGFTRNLVQNSYMGCCMAFRRKILEKVLPFPSNLVAHDQWIGLVAEKHYRVHFLNKPLVQYRRHGQNHSFTGEKSPFGLFKKINYRLNMLYNLATR